MAGENRPIPAWALRMMVERDQLKADNARLMALLHHLIGSAAERWKELTKEEMERELHRD